MKTCPFFGICGGCKYDFTDAAYRANKLTEISKLPITDEPRWIESGTRRRADFCFAGDNFGLFKPHSKNIIPVRSCPNLVQEINNILPRVAELPWGASGSCLITACENGIDVVINSDVPYFSPEFKRAAEKVGAIRIVWNDKVVVQIKTPIIKIGNISAL